MAQVTYEGVCFAKRNVSKKLVFMDLKRLERPTQAADEAQPEHSEAMFIVGTFGDVQAMEMARREVKVGDELRVSGQVDDHGCLHAEACEVLSRWADRRTGERHAFELPDETSRCWWASMVAARGAKRSGRGRQQQQQGSGNGGLHDVGAGAGVGAVGAALPQGAVEGQQGQQGEQQQQEQEQQEDTQQQQMHHEGMPQGQQQQQQQQQGQQRAGALPICKYWINTGKCARGDLCPYYHLPQGEDRRQVVQGWIGDRLTRRRQLRLQDGLHNVDNSSAKKFRAVLFARWLVQAFGVEALSRGSGVLDVAGGRGALTWQLQVVHGVKVTLVEPRPFKMSKDQHKALKAMWTSPEPQPRDAAHSNGGGGNAAAPEPDHAQASGSGTPNGDGAVPGSGDVSESDDEGEEGHDGQAADLDWQGLASAGAAEEEGGDGTASGMGTGGNLQHPVQSQGAPDDATVVRHYLGPGVGHVTQLQSLFTEQLWRRALDGEGGAGGGEGPGAEGNREGLRHCVEVVRECSVVVGLHPDQATEEIIQFAKASGKPFAIVPCCVFPRLFKHRRLQPPQQQQDRREGLASAASGAAQAETDDEGLFGATPVELRPPHEKSLPAEGGVPVATYPDLVAYLRQEGAPAQEALLPFEGANKVVFRTGAAT